MNLTRCHWHSTDKFRVQQNCMTKSFYFSALKFISWNLSAERRKYIQWYKSTLKGKSRKLCSEFVAANMNVRGKFESLQTLFWIERSPSCQDLFNWNKGIRLVPETKLLKLFPTFTIDFVMYSEAWPLYIFNAEWKLSSLFLSQQCWEFDWFHWTELCDHFMQIIFVTCNCG